MTITRAKATRLLNATEMGLYDDSRANAVRGHTDAKLARLIIRARASRDRARDLEKRQRLASRSTTGSKSGRSGLANVRTGEKATLLSDILVRLETREKDNAKSAKAAAKVAKSAKAGTTSSKTKTQTSGKATTSKRAPAKSAARGSAASKKATTETAAKGATVTRQATRNTITTKTTATKATGKTGSKTAASKAPAKSASTRTERSAGRRATPATEDGSKGASGSRGASRAISPARALKNTKALLAQKDAETAQGRMWEELGGDGTAQAAPGYQSGRARSQALALHAAETRQASINGSISTRDRRNQGKRDHRNKPD